MNISFDFNRAFAIEKGLSILVVLALVLFLTHAQTFIVMVIAALGHFFLADIYRMKKKTPARWQFAAYFAILAVLFYLAYRFTGVFLISVTSLFMFHCFWDEYKLLGVKPDAFSTLLIVMMVSVLALWMTGDTYRLDIDFILSFWIIASGVIVLAFGVFAALRGTLVVHTNIILFGLAYLAFITAYFADALPYAMTVARWVIIFHGSSWYIFLGRRYYREDMKKFRIYIRDVVGIIGLLTIGFVLYLRWPGELSFLNLLFYSAPAYFTWAMLHLITTLRPGDYRYLFPAGRLSIKE